MGGWGWCAYTYTVTSISLLLYLFFFLHGFAPKKGGGQLYNNSIFLYVLYVNLRKLFAASKSPPPLDATRLPSPEQVKFAVLNDILIMLENTYRGNAIEKH